MEPTKLGHQLSKTNAVEEAQFPMIRIMPPRRLDGRCSGDELSHWPTWGGFAIPKYPAVGQAWSSASVSGIAPSWPNLLRLCTVRYCMIHTYPGIAVSIQQLLDPRHYHRSTARQKPARARFNDESHRPGIALANLQTVS